MRNIRFLPIFWILIATLVSTCAGSQGSIERKPEWIRLPAQTIRSELPINLGKFFPGSDLKIQAVGNPNQRVDDPSTDRNAYLLNATRLPSLSLGYRVLSPAMARNYGTYQLVELIRQVGDQFDQTYPGHEFHIGDLSKQKGGTIRESNGKRVHSSHRNGLDADINLLYNDCHDDGTWSSPSCPMDIEKNMDLIRSLIRSGPYRDQSIVDSIYVSPEFVDNACRYVKGSQSKKESYQEIFPYLQIRAEHPTHFHVRIKCPENSLQCPASRPLSTRDICSRSHRPPPVYID
jgi:penicillin-insensitive murein DD-endopeptidase